MALNRRVYVPRSGRRVPSKHHLSRPRTRSSRKKICIGKVPPHPMRLTCARWSCSAARAARLTLTAERCPGESRNALLRREVGDIGSSRHQRDRLVEPVHLAPFPTPDAIGKVALAHVRASADRERAAAMEVYGLGKKYDVCLWSPAECVEVSVGVLYVQSSVRRRRYR